MKDACLRISCILFLPIVLGACNIQTGRNNYVLAERLFTDQKYAASVQEFEKIVNSNPKSVLGQQAIYRIATIQYLYLENYPEAVRKYKQFIALSKSKELGYEADKNIGEIYFNKIEDYRLSLEQYQRILEKYPETVERDFFLLRVAKSYFGLMDFQKAIETYNEILEKFPDSKLAPEVSYQTALAYFTRGDCDLAIKTYNKVIAKYPSSVFAAHSQMGVAQCLEELERPIDALDAYRAVKKGIVSSKILESKIHRLEAKVEKKR